MGIIGEKTVSLDNPKVSVIMSVLNGEKYLCEAVDSILNQTFQNFEFIIINDGSTDTTADILKRYDDPRIVIINNENNIGVTKSLNIGLHRATTKYIARQDADDVSLPSRLEKEVDFLDKNADIGLIGTYFYVINEAGNIIRTVKLATECWELKEKLLEKNQFCAGSIMFKRECIEEVGFYREQFECTQDYDLWLRISEKYNLANIPEPLYKWRLNPKSISISKRVQQVRFAEFARELAKERIQSGRDRLQILEKEEVEKILNSLSSKTKPLTRNEIAIGYYFWGRLLFRCKDYKGALKLLFKSAIKNPLHRNAWVTIFRTIILWLFPNPVIAILRFMISRLIPKQVKGPVEEVKK